MYPSQTSLIPVTVSLARFVETNGLSAFGNNYPYWYLGTTPFKFLTGPILPNLIVILHRLFSNISLFTITIAILAISFLLSAVGWGILIKKIQNSKSLSIIVLLLLIFPWRYLAAFSLDEGSVTIARNLLPFSFWAIWKHFENKNKKSFFIALFTSSFLLLIDTSILPILFVGITALILTKSYTNNSFVNISKYVKVSFVLAVSSLLLITVWYTPSYWLTILANPSIGGVTGLKVILRILDILRGSLPSFLAVFVVYFSGKIGNRFSVFILTWLFAFSFLTIFRFFGDPDFWMDWTVWLYEIEIGIAILIANNFQLIRKSSFVIALLLLPFTITLYIYAKIDKPNLISNKLPQGIRSLGEINMLAKNETVFLSGSTVFWADALYDIYQLRGGVDRVAVNSDWNRAAYELREGISPDSAKSWFIKLDISYVLVHGPTSKEYYQDFKNIKKWESIGSKIWEKDGDTIYAVKTVK